MRGDLRAKAILFFLASVAGQPLRAQEIGGFELSGGAYLYHYAPMDVAGAEDKTEVYALFVSLDREEGRWAFHSQTRLRDTRLRPFFPSNVWVQEMWVAYNVPTPLLTFRAGKIYQHLGRFWDASFFGNVHYFDGLKLDPEFGAEAVGTFPLGGAAVLELTGQYLAQSDRVNGALAERDIEGFEDSREEDGVALGIRFSAPPASVAGRPVVTALGVSGLRERARWVISDGAEPVDARLDHLAVDVEVGVQPLVAYAEWTRRSVEDVPLVARASPAGSRATYWLLGAQLSLGCLQLRYNYSRGRYDDARFAERIHQPGLTLKLTDGIHSLLEYDDWRRDLSGAGAVRVDRSLNFVILAEL
jgi:hypothetical protein